jgi:predicted transcriptional regulator
MATKMQTKRSAKLKPRLSVSFPPDLKKTLEQIAKEQKVSLGWIVREAAEKYVGDRWPLLTRR